VKALVLLAALSTACAAPRACPEPPPDTIAAREDRLSEHARDWLESLRQSYECDIAREGVKRAARDGDEAALREHARAWSRCRGDR
jgi:hypothetical protein